MAEEESHNGAEQSSDMDEGVHFIGARNAILFSADAGEPLPPLDLPDDFFELGKDDVRVLFRDLKENREVMENTPFRTKAVREMEESMAMLQRLNRYTKTVLRIQFPDRLVLQAVFNHSDSVQTVMDFVRQFLDPPDVQFQLYTTPPKCLLKLDATMVDAKLTPRALVYFGAIPLQDRTTFLKPSLLTQLTSPKLASEAALHYRGRGKTKGPLDKCSKEASETNFAENMSAEEVSSSSLSTRSSHGGRSSRKQNKGRSLQEESHTDNHKNKLPSGITDYYDLYDVVKVRKSSSRITTIAQIQIASKLKTTLKKASRKPTSDIKPKPPTKTKVKSIKITRKEQSNLKNLQRQAKRQKQSEEKKTLTMKGDNKASVISGQKPTRKRNLNVTVGNKSKKRISQTRVEEMKGNKGKSGVKAKTKTAVTKLLVERNTTKKEKVTKIISKSLRPQSTKSESSKAHEVDKKPKILSTAVQKKSETKKQRATIRKSSMLSGLASKNTKSSISPKTKTNNSNLKRPYTARTKAKLTETQGKAKSSKPVKGGRNTKSQATASSLKQSTKTKVRNVVKRK